MNVSTIYPTYHPFRARDLAKAAIALCREKPRHVAVLAAGLSYREQVDLHRAVHDALAPGEAELDQPYDVRWGYRSSKVYLQNRSQIAFYCSLDSIYLAGCVFDAIVHDGASPGLLKEATKRLRPGGGPE